MVHIPVIAANLYPFSRTGRTAAGKTVFRILFHSADFYILLDPHCVIRCFEGKEDEIASCICCLYCFEKCMMEGAYVGDHGHRSVNPFAGRESEKFKQKTETAESRLLSVGAAGLMAAELLAKRKFDVNRTEKEKAFGGQLNLADKPPTKRKKFTAVRMTL